MSDTELAWCAGFLDGEGSFGAYVRKSSKSQRAKYRIQAAQSDREVLDRLQTELGGKVAGPYGPYTTQRKPYYNWAVWGQEAVEVTERLWPYLSSVKLKQAGQAMEIMS